MPEIPVLACLLAPLSDPAVNQRRTRECHLAQWRWADLLAQKKATPDGKRYVRMGQKKCMPDERIWDHHLAWSTTPRGRV